MEPWGNADRRLMLGATFWFAAACLYLISEGLAASGFPGYSYASNFISDLGVPYHGMLAGRELNSTLAIVMNYGGFIPHGICFALAAGVMLPEIGAGKKARALLIVLVALHTLGSCLLALVPGGNREVANGLYLIHCLGATMAILGGNLAALTFASHLRLVVAARSYRLASYALISAALVGIGLLVIWPHAPTSGVFERCCVYSIMAWELMTAGYIFLAISQRADLRKRQPLPTG